jgi:hypothetical protein
MRIRGKARRKAVKRKWSRHRKRSPEIPGGFAPLIPDRASITLFLPDRGHFLKQLHSCCIRVSRSSRESVTAAILLTILLPASPAVLNAADAPTVQPNVVFILADDQRFDELG